jgi:2-polyprenyl-3-methyl-5-hydroxy-6-metoxy-1,4-benzoquinol methylase
MNPEDVNLKRWNELAAIHAASDYYHIDQFLGEDNFSTLSAIEKAEIGSLENKTLLHLQCHIGTDTLSLARRGAQVTGIDFSSKSIEQARTLAKQAALDADFIVSNVYDVPEKIDQQFDVVYSNWGSLCWLKDLAAWAKVIHHCLKPGGMLYLADIHPFGLLYARDKKYQLKEAQSYFPDTHNSPNLFMYAHTYTDQNIEIENKDFYQWPYMIADVVTYLCQNGLQIEYLREHPYSTYQQMPGMKKLENGLYVIPQDQNQIPLTFTLKAHKQ